jgi:hypothetical protein
MVTRISADVVYYPHQVNSNHDETKHPVLHLTDYRCAGMGWLELGSGNP